MGYDYSIDVSRDECPTCKRSNNAELYQGYLSYNHSWVFRKYLESDVGFRQLYLIPLPQVIEKLDHIITRLRIEYPDTYLDNWKNQCGYDNTLEPYEEQRLSCVTNIDGNQVRYDGWATTVGNAYLHLRELLVKCKELVLDGYDDAIIYGD